MADTIPGRAAKRSAPTLEDSQPLIRQHGPEASGVVRAGAQRELPRRTPGEQRAQLLESNGEPKVGGDVEVGGVEVLAADDAVCLQRLDVVDLIGKRAE